MAVMPDLRIAAVPAPAWLSWLAANNAKVSAVKSCGLHWQEQIAVCDTEIGCLYILWPCTHALVHLTLTRGGVGGGCKPRSSPLPAHAAVCSLLTMSCLVEVLLLPAALL